MEDITLSPDEITELYQHFRNELLARIAYMMRDKDSAEDVLQNVFMKIVKYPHLKDKKNLRAWLYQVTTRMVIDAVRARQCHEKLAPMSSLSLEANDEGQEEWDIPDNRATKPLECLMIEETIECMSPMMQEALRLYSAGYTCVEAGKILGIPWQSAHRRMKQARQSFQKWYGKAG